MLSRMTTAPSFAMDHDHAWSRSLRRVTGKKNAETLSSWETQSRFQGLQRCHDLSSEVSQPDL